LQYKLLIILFFLFVSKLSFTQKFNIKPIDSLCNKKITGIVFTITDVTFSKQINYTSCGIGGALQINDKAYLGIYGMGLMSEIKASDFNYKNEISDYQVSFSNGGIFVGYKNTQLKNISFSSTLKFGYGAIFMYNSQLVIDYNYYRDEVIIINPSFDTEIYITNWLKLNVGVGVKFIHGFSEKFINQDGNQIQLYNGKSFEGFNLSFSLFLGSFCKYQRINK
jgi:hypothetical protein